MLPQESDGGIGDDGQPISPNAGATRLAVDPQGTQYILRGVGQADDPGQLAGTINSPSGHVLVPYTSALAFAQQKKAGSWSESMKTLGPMLALGAGAFMASPLAAAGAGAAGVGAESAVAGGLEYSGIVDAFEWGSAASGATVGAAEGGSIATGAGVGAESAVVGGLEYAGVPSVAAPALASAGAVTGTAGAAELMGPSAVELGVPGATGYAAPYAVEAAGAAVAPATVGNAATGASTGAGANAELGQFMNSFSGTMNSAPGTFTTDLVDGGGILSSVIDWAQKNQMLASAGVTVGGGIINRALAPTPKEQADAAFQAKLQAENQAADARRSRNRFNLNLNRLKPTGAVLRQPGIIRGSMPRQP